MRNVVLALGAVVLALLLVAPFFLDRRGDETAGGDWLPVPFTHDMRQHLSVLRQLDFAVRAGDFYPRWQSEFNKGYGLPWLNYYPPGFYWFAEIFFLATGDPVDAFFIVCVLMMIGCGVATYALAREFFTWQASAGAAAMYMLAPYHSVDLYWRGALAELAGFVFVPAVLLCAHRAGTSPGARWTAALGLVHGMYLMTHFPVSYLMTIVLGAYAVVWAFLERDVRVALRIVAGLAWALVASSVYWLVAALERKHVSETFSGDFQYHRSYIVLAESEPWVQWLNLAFVGIGVMLVTAILVAGTQSDTQKRLFRMLAVATVFMVTPYSMYFAKLIPRIDNISFAWRWMVIAALFVSLLAAMAIERLRSAPRVYAVLFVAALAFNVVTTVRLIVPALKQPNLEAGLSFVETGFVPGRAGDPFQLPDMVPRAVLAPGDGSVHIEKWEPLRREMVVTTPRESLLMVRTYRFRGWTARVDGRKVELGMDQYGAQIVRVMPGRHRVVVTFEDPRTRKVLAGVSAIAFLAALVIIPLSPRAGRGLG